MAKNATKNDLNFNRRHDFAMPEVSVVKAKRGISTDIVQSISDYKKEELWMQKFRQEAYKKFIASPLPSWGPDLSKIDFDDIIYFLRATDKQERSWDDLPDEIKETYDR
ncbi:MAG: Fe-S cluster assembly protein SufB, partial [Patescibacteria group bacterium]|nr:Fe-S cluster assembly protein SufB [Patescibacteria group bacterium]